MELSKRLRAVADLVTAGYQVADIGTDHAYIPIFLAETGKTDYAVAMDVNKGPLRKAQENICAYKMEEQIETRLSDGFSALKVQEVQSAVIAGMGGNLVIRILEEGHDVVSCLKECILQPQSEPDKVRAFLLQEGFFFMIPLRVAGCRGKGMLEVFRKTSIFIGGCWCCARPVPRKAKSLQGMRIQGTIFPNPHFFQEHGTMRHWLFKSEPDCYSFTDLENAPGQTTSWDGVRNYQARNFMRDDMKKGDLGFFYHSGKNPEIAGIVEIVREGHPDFTAQDPEAGHFDPKATPGDPRWYMVDVKLVRRFEPPVPRSLLRFVPELAGMELMKTGSRLSVQPVEAEAYAAIVRLADQLAADKAAGQEVKA